MSTAREAPCVHTQKLKRSTSDTSEGIPFAWLTRSRTYCHGSDTPRFGFAFNQCGPSTFQASHVEQSSDGNHFPASWHASQGSNPHTNANQVSFSSVPSSTFREYSWCAQQTDVRSNPE